MAGEDNPDDPAQARSQMSEHVQSGGALAGPTGARFRRYALSVVTRFSSLLECCRIADRLNGNGAAKTAFVHLCLPKWATVDTTYLADLPTGYIGQFGPKVRAWVLALYYADGMSEPKILDLLQTVGMSISAGQLSDMLIKDQEQFHTERAHVLQAGLSSSPWHHLDSTGTAVNGTNEQCHILCNPLYTAYCTLPAKDRLSLLRVLQGGADPVFQLNALAMALMVQLDVSEKWCRALPTLLPRDQTYTENQLDDVLDAHLPKQGANLRKRVKEALAIATYRTQTTYPVVQLLLCDDAPQFNWLTVQLALCWIHEYRHYKKLTPRFLAHCHILEQFAKDFWNLYRALVAYRHAPSQAEAEALRAEFEHLFGQRSGYDQLD